MTTDQKWLKYAADWRREVEEGTAFLATKAEESSTRRGLACLAANAVAADAVSYALRAATAGVLSLAAASYKGEYAVSTFVEGDETERSVKVSLKICRGGSWVGTVEHTLPWVTSAGIDAKAPLVYGIRVVCPSIVTAGVDKPRSDA